VPEEPVRQPGAVAERPVTPAAPAPGAPPLEDVFFDFDKSDLLADAKASLNRNLAWLKANAAVNITMEGHADERGTTEYNLALGERRAKAVQEYLVAAGIAAARIKTISYGEERPFVLGHDESAWRYNRRGHFAVQR
jgi:peptidoglycan-associated lipoprotein